MAETPEERRVYYKKKYPELPAETIEKIVKLRGIPLAKGQQEKALQLWGAGVIYPDIIRRLHVSESSIHITGLVYPEFKAAWTAIRKNRKKQIESMVTQYMLGKVKETKVTRTAVLDKDGKPVFSGGKQKFVAVKVETQYIPPPLSLLMDWLKKEYPEAYQKVEETVKPDQLPTEPMRLLSEELKKLA